MHVIIVIIIILISSRVVLVLLLCLLSAFQSLLWCPHIIVSRRVSTCDPLGPLLFYNAIYLRLVRLFLCRCEPIAIWMILPWAALQRYLHATSKELLMLEVLYLNISKCELISNTDFQVSDATLKSFSHTSIADASLLNAPLFPGAVLDETWAARCSELCRSVERLKCLGSQYTDGQLCYIVCNEK